MFETAVVLFRWVQMTGAMVLFGSSLFCLYALPVRGPGSTATLGWPRPVLITSAAAVLAACILGLLAQTVVLAGDSVHDAMQFDALSAVLTSMGFGKASLVRAVIAVVLLVGFAVVKPGRPSCWWASPAGGAICISLAWMGHGAATQGPLGWLHLVSDILHILAAAVWIGALVAFLILLIWNAGEGQEHLHQALHGFSGIGSGLVAVLLATGLINSAFMVGLSGLAHLWATPYGQLLTVKVVLFLAMVGLAASNRFHLTPRLGAALAKHSSPQQALRALRNSLALETSLALAVLGLVAWFGMLAPPSAG